MSINKEILSKVQSKQINILSGLGMPANRIHQLIEGLFVAKLFDVCEEYDLSVMPEGKNKDYENSTRIADVLIIDDFDFPIVVIEICAEETYEEAQKRISDFFNTNPNSMKEGFIYNFNYDTWDYYYNNEKQSSAKTFCKTVKRDLNKILQNSKVYNKMIKTRLKK